MRLVSPFRKGQLIELNEIGPGASRTGTNLVRTQTLDSVCGH